MGRHSHSRYYCNTGLNRLGKLYNKLPNTIKSLENNEREGSVVNQHN